MRPPSRAAANVTTTACRATPPNNERDDAPMALSTAKSRTRCRAETYTRAATMTAATTHMNRRELSTDCTALCIGRMVSRPTAEEVRTSRPGGLVVGTPLVTTAVTRG